MQTTPLQNASLRIALVTETFAPEVNGVAMTMGRIVRALIARGHHIQLVRPRQANEEHSASLSDLLAGLEVVLCEGMPVPGYPQMRFGFPAKAKLKALWQTQRPDVVHVVTEGPLGYSAVSAAKELGLPLTSSFHTNFQSYSQNYGAGLLKNIIDGYLRRFHNRTQTTMVPTLALKQELQSRGYQNVSILSRGIDTHLFSPSKRSDTLRAIWNVASSDLVVILVGRLAKEKNAELVVKAFHAIKQKIPHAKLVFVGEGPLKAALQSSCPDAIFAGTQKGEALAEHYASADLFLFPSLTETFGNVVPEALASGLAVVSYDHASAGELIETDVNGIKVAFDDADAFVRESVRMALDSDLQAKLRLAAPASVAHLSWEGIYDCFVSHLSSACPILMREPSINPSASENPLGASTMTVEPC